MKFILLIGVIYIITIKLLFILSHKRFGVQFEYYSLNLDDLL